MGGPALQIIDPQGIFLADLFGFILSLPESLSGWPVSGAKPRRRWLTI